MTEETRQDGTGPPQDAPSPPASPPPAYSAGAAAGRAQAPPWWMTPPKRSSFVKRLFVGLFVLVFLLSIVMNGYLLLLLSAHLEAGMSQTVLEPGDEEQTVAVYQVQGVIGREAAANFYTFYNEIRDDQNVKAVVLRVDSPGGGMSSSDRIYAMIKELRSEGKKVVVSMGGLAASGGYYISAPADEIIAEPTTWTGSIGVMLGWLVMEGTFEKIGLDAVVMKSHRAEGWKDTPSSFRKIDARQREYLQKLLDGAQERFESVVIEARGTKDEGGKISVKEVTYSIVVGKGKDAKEIEHTEQVPFNGKVYTADEAKQIGLIDDIGYEQKAIDRAAALAGLHKPKVVLYQPRKGLMERMLRAESRAPLDLSVETLDRLQTPRLLLLWRAD